LILVGIVQAGFDAKKFAASAFNFVYTERTQTLNWPSWALYLIIPIFSVSMLVHGLANLLEDLDLAPRMRFASFKVGGSEGWGLGILCFE